MKIILVGGGKVGTALARQLSEEDHNVTIVDTNKARVEHLTESYDVLGIVGNGSSITTLAEAGIEDADVFIAVTGSDELNLLCCMFAKKAGHCHAIARVRNPSYSHELDFIKKQIGISAIINPEMAAAKEISHLLRFPGASKIDTFADGRVRLIKFALTAEQGLDGVAIREIPTRLKSDILVCAVERSGGVIIPNGNFVLQNGDQVTFLATQEKAHEFFQRIHLAVRPVRNALIVAVVPSASTSVRSCWKTMSASASWSGTRSAAMCWPSPCRKRRSCARMARTASFCSLRGWSPPKPSWL